MITQNSENGNDTAKRICGDASNDREEIRSLLGSGKKDVSLQGCWRGIKTRIYRTDTTSLYNAFTHYKLVDGIKFTYYLKYMRISVIMIYLSILLSFLLRDQKKRNQRKVTDCVSGVAKNTSHSNFGGDKTRCAQTVSPLTEILAPFLTPDTMPEVTDPLTFSLHINSANEH